MSSDDRRNPAERRALKVASHVQPSPTAAAPQASDRVNHDATNPNNVAFDGKTPNSVRDSWIHPKQKILTPEQAAFFEENGYLLIKKLIDPAKIERWRKRFVDLCEKPELRPESMAVVRDVSLAKKGVAAAEANSEEMITKLQDWCDEEVLMEYCRDEALLDYVAAFTGDGIQAMHTMLINKPPDTGVGSSRHPLHQDLLYFPFRPAERTVAAWTAMQKIDEDNGCLHVLPGTHRTPLLKHGYPEDGGIVNKAYHGILGLPEKMDLLKVPMDVGDCIFFHPLLWHGSGPNFSKRYRKAISCHFASTTESTYINVDGTIQSEMQEEIRDMLISMMKKRGINVKRSEVNVDLADIWNMKSAVVRGDRSIDDMQNGAVPQFDKKD